MYSLERDWLLPIRWYELAPPVGPYRLLVPRASRGATGAGSALVSRPASGLVVCIQVQRWVISRLRWRAKNVSFWRHGGARVSVCGQISQYNLQKPEPGPCLLAQILVRQLQVAGFIVTRFKSAGRKALRRWRGGFRKASSGITRISCKASRTHPARSSTCWKAPPWPRAAPCRARVHEKRTQCSLYSQIASV